MLADIVYLDTCQAALLTFVAVNNGSCRVGLEGMGLMKNLESREMFAEHRKRVESLTWPCIAGFAAVLFASPISAIIGLPIWSIELAGSIVGGCFLYVMSRPFRCPGCRTNLMFHVMFKGPIGNWVEGALAFRSCPRCGFPENDASRKSRQS